MGLVSTDGEIIDHLSYPTKELQNIEVFLERLQEMINLLLHRQTSYIELLGIGVGAPGHSLNTGEIVGAVNLPFRNSIPIVSFLKERFQIPSFLIKDAKAAALGEKRWGAGRQTDHFVLLMLGTGLGYAAIIDGQVLNGYQGLSSELGHTILIPNGRICNCGKKGCSETYISATGLKRTAFELMSSEVMPSKLRSYSFKDLHPREIARIANEGDLLAQLTFQRTGKYLGILMANLTEQLTPAVFLLAGGLSKAGNLLIQPARETLEHQIQPIYRNKIKIQLSALGSSEVGMLGAAALVLENIIYQP